MNDAERIEADMTGSIDTYLAVLNCKCEALCTCDDTTALKAASMAVDTRPQT
jgi:hypothetical protein